METRDTPNPYMVQALIEAEAAAAQGEVPVGAVVVDSRTGEIIGRGHNRTEADHDPAGHAEIIALRQACAVVGAPRLPDCDLYVTLEPCAMCATAISFARVARVYYGASDPKSGGVAQGARVFSHPQCHHVPEVYDGISEAACAEVLRAFFRERR